MTRQAEAALVHGMADVEPGVRLHVSEFRVPRTGHWIAEENPDALMKVSESLSDHELSDVLMHCGACHEAQGVNLSCRRARAIS